MSNKQDAWAFRFHSVMHNASQDTIYDTLAHDVVAQSINGTNGTIMAYGQTGAGKTFTMIGDTRNYKHRGVAPRAIAQVFSEVSSRAETEFTIKATYIEIYNDRIYDLMAAGTEDAGVEHNIVEEKGGRGIQVRGLKEVAVETEEDALNVLFEGDIYRHTAEHQLNKSSNRSHCIYTLHIAQRSRLGGGEKLVYSKLNFVDLAGSERLKKTMEVEDHGGKHVAESVKRESMFINRSLTYLEQCVVALTSKSRGHVPYRQTKLTNILKDSIGGNSNTVMISCIWGESAHLEETISTLKFSSRMMRVHNETTATVSRDPSLLIKRYEREIRELKQELAMHDALADRFGVTYDEYTPEQQAEVHDQVQAFLAAAPEKEEEAIEIDSVRKMREILRQTKIIVRNLEVSIEEKLRSKYSLHAKAGGGAAAGAGDDGAAGAGGAAGGDAGDGSGGGDMVGDLEGTGGYAVGQAPSGARPAQVTQPAGAGVSWDASAGDDAPGSASSKSLHKRGASSGSAAMDDEFTDRPSAYKHYRTDEGLGADQAAALAAAKEYLAGIKDESRALTKKVNASKRRIDDLTKALDEKRSDTTAARPAVAGAAAGDDEVIVDEEEFRLMKELGDEKKSYRANFTELRALKAEVADKTAEVEGLKAKLLEGFEDWFRTVNPEAAAEAEAKAAREAEEREAQMLGPVYGDDGDALDDGEAFEKLEMERVSADDPDSLAYFNAQKKMQSTLRATRGRRK